MAKYEKMERQEGLHLLVGVRINGEWWALRQMQLVNNKWTQAGCHWYIDSEIQKLLEKQDNETKTVDSGEGRIESVGEYQILVSTDNNGLEYLV